MKESPPHAVALFSGGLDGALAAALVAGYSRRADAAKETPTVRVTDATGVRVMPVKGKLTRVAFAIL